MQLCTLELAFFGIGMKIDFSSPVATAEFSKFAGILSTALSQHHFLDLKWKILKEMGIPDHLARLLRNLYAGQEATVRTEHGTID